jgi:phosphatidate cytidylyltransferase
LPAGLKKTIMALNLATFRTRTLTAVIFVAVMLGGLLVNHWTFFILFSIIHFGCWVEYQKLVGRIDPGYAGILPLHRYGVMVAGWCWMLYCAAAAFGQPWSMIQKWALWAGMAGLVALLLAEFLLTRPARTRNIVHSIFGLCYISLCWGLMVLLREWGPKHPGPGIDKSYGILLPCLLIFSIWVNDTMAYIVGSLIGKTPFSKISPKKTWEGTLGGALLCVALMSLLGHTWGFSWRDGSAIAAISAVMGTTGDLLESKLKRMADLKDSGSIMPGHGGFLDRFDSLLLATPFVWLYAWLFMG